MAAVADPDRLRALQATGLLDAPRDEAFDRTVRLARRLVGAPVALLSLVDADRQFFLGEEGLAEPTRSARETPLSQSFCQHVVLREGPLAVGDARRDPLVADNEAVTALDVTAYLGVPVRAPGGEVLGALCVLDSEPRTWGADDLDALTDLAGVASAEIRARVARRDAASADASARSRAGDEETLLRLAVEAARCGVWMTDLGTGDMFWDPRCRAIFGVGPDVEASAELRQSLVHPDDRAAVADAFAAALADPQGAYRTEKRLVRSDGAVRWVLSVGQIFRDATGEPARIVGLTTDVTARKEAEEERRERRLTLEREVAARTEALQQQADKTRRLAGALALTDLRERQRVAHALHEDLQQILFGLGLHLGAARLDGAEQDPTLQDLVDRALQLTRSLSHELAAPGPLDGRLDRAVEWLATSVHEGYGLEVHVESSGAVEVDDDVRDAAVQLAREALFNVAKHAGVSAARVSVYRAGASAVVEVEDEGVGFNVEALDTEGREGIGLQGVRSRAGLIGGACDIVSAPGEGTRVTIRVPARPHLLPPARTGRGATGGVPPAPEAG